MQPHKSNKYIQMLKVLYLARLAAALAAFLTVATGPGSLMASEARVCWSPETLRTQPGEANIQKNIKAAFVPIPRQRPKQLAPLPAARRGAIRSVRLPPGDKRIALTFDLCEQPYEITGYQGGIVDYLRAENIPATFFAGGKWLLTHTRRAVQLMADERFEIANHSWEHRNHRLISGVALANAIDGAQSAYEITRSRLAASACISPNARSATARPAADHVPLVQKHYRFPFGACNQQALDAVNDRGLHVIQWDVSSADPWRGMTADAMVKHVLARTKPGSILLFHANGRGWNTGAALPKIVASLRAKGYKFDTVSGLLETKGATPVIASTFFDHRPGDSERYDAVGRKLIEKYNEFYTRFGNSSDQPK